MLIIIWPYTKCIAGIIHVGLSIVMNTFLCHPRLLNKLWAWGLIQNNYCIIIVCVCVHDRRFYFIFLTSDTTPFKEINVLQFGIVSFCLVEDACPYEWKKLY